ncbi:MAG: sulfate transporter CysZ [Halofilum sp. (in: g-proteobacteria)]
MITDFARGAGYALQGFRLVRRPGVSRYALLPLLINVLVFGTGIWFGAAAFQDFLQWVLPAWLDLWFVRALLWLLFAIGAALVSFYAFTLLANLVAAPFNGLLADRVERELRGGRGEEGIQRGLVGEATASIGAEIRKLIHLAAWALPLLLLFLIPGINLAAPFLWLAFGAWMLALEYADCPLGNHGVTFREARGLIARRRGVALGFGTVIMGMTAVPGLNLIAMPVAVCGATALYVGELSALVPQGHGTATAKHGRATSD